MSTENRSLMGSRLREERDRLGKSQGEMAELADTKLRTYQDWERGIAAVSSEFLLQVAPFGVDVLYVLTGGRMPSGQVLTREEDAVLDNYRNAAEPDKATARRVLDALAQSPKQKRA